MRISRTASAILTVATVMTAAPAEAQTYDPHYSVCLQAYTIDGSFIDCRYHSLAQCAEAASGRGAECLINPYFARAQAPAVPRRHRRAY